MNKETYKAEKAIIKSKIEELTSQLKALDEQYIQSNNPFDIGEKVKVVEVDGKERFAFINRIKITWNDDVIPKLFKAKKDGTPSKFEDYLWRDEKIEKLTI